MLNLNMAKHLEFTFSTLEMQGVEDQVKCHGDKESHLAWFFFKTSQHHKQGEEDCYRFEET